VFNTDPLWRRSELGGKVTSYLGEDPMNTKAGVPARSRTASCKKECPVEPLAEDAWQMQEEFLNEALEETFPASDPIAPSLIAPKASRKQI
jgi:hypothetical protein